MVYSSGTTGASKGIQLTNNSINWAIAENMPFIYGFQRMHKCFCQIPIWFSTGLITMGMVPLYYGVTLILEPIYDFLRFEKSIEKYAPNYIITATGLIEYLISKKNKRLGKTWECLAIGGEYAPPSIEKKTNQWLNKCNNKTVLRKGYGMCECGGSAVASSLICNAIGSAGIPLPHVIISAFDMETGKELKYGARGEIRVMTPCRMLEYYNRPAETAKRLHTDSEGNVWVCTGDMGYVSEDGNIYISGRISDSYIDSNGETVYLFDIEHAILDIPEIRQCKAVSIEYSGKPTHVCHIVTDKNSESNTVLSEIKNHCANTLPENHRPKLIHIYDEALPVAPSGKLDTLKMKRVVDDLIEL